MMFNNDDLDEDLDEFEALENHVNSLHNTNNDHRISVSRRYINTKKHHYTYMTSVCLSVLLFVPPYFSAVCLQFVFVCNMCIKPYLFLAMRLAETEKLHRRPGITLNHG